MDEEKRESTEKIKNDDFNEEAILKKCLEENKGDSTNCKSKVEAFKSSSSPKKPITPLRLRSGSLTDV